MKTAGSTFLLLTVLLTSTVFARDIGQDEALSLHRSGQILSLTELWNTALARYPQSRLLEAELEEDDGQLIYEVELITPSGMVREIEIDATNGTILKDEED